MNRTVIDMHTGFRIGRVDPRIFGGFLEHIGRAVYQGVYDPKSIHADKNGFRKDVLSALRKLRMTAMRYPGGNFVSGYHWLDGVGPVNRRPVVRELAWQSTEPNHFGTDEYMKLCREMGWTPMLAVNLGTGTPEEAGNWVEYCNCPAGTRFADMRAANGSVQPHAVGLWCLGNEMDGKWQLGYVPADQYAIRAQQAAKIMKDIDRSIELVVCGSCTMNINTYMDWDRQVLEYVGDLADYVSLHCYVGNRKNDTADYLAVGNSIDRQIEEMDAACRFVQARTTGRKRGKRAYLCFDEWNVWYKEQGGNGEGKFAPHLLEEVYNLEDALAVASFLHSFVRHADVLKIANLAQIVNVIAPILTQGDAMLVQSIFYPFEMFSRRRDGISLRLALDGPTYESPSHGKAHLVDASAILGEGKLHVFLTNRSDNSNMEICVRVSDCDVKGVENAEILTGSDPKAANSFENPDLIKTRPFPEVKLLNGQVVCSLPPLSLTAMTCLLK